MTGNVVDLGHLEYTKATDIQRRVLESVSSGALGHTLLLVEHDPVLTLGANFHEENLIYPLSHYESLGIDLQPTDRGGDITFHGPKQLVIYPIFDVALLGKDLHKWLRDLEEALIVALQSYGLNGYRFPPNTGVWVEDRKIAAIGIKIRRWISMHGIALNCNNDLTPFRHIIPCGIKEYGVTSLSQELGRQVTIEDAKPVVVAAFEKVFGLEIKPRDMDDLSQHLTPNT